MIKRIVKVFKSFIDFVNWMGRQDMQAMIQHNECKCGKQTND